MISLYIGSLHFITWGGVMNKPYAYYEHKKLNNFKELLILNLENKKDEVTKECLRNYWQNIIDCINSGNVKLF